MRLLVTQIEETVAWMVRVQAKFGAIVTKTTARTHSEWLPATVAELVLALCTCKVHAAPSVYNSLIM